MGVSAVGARGIQPRTVPVLFFGVLAALAVLLYMWGPAVTPGLRGAAEDRCNQMAGSNYRSFRLDWQLPKSPSWDLPHWSCRDARDVSNPNVNLGWWVNPF